MKKLKTPYEHLIPPLTDEEQEALKADIRKNGILMPLIVDEDDNILDGHHRYKLKRKDQEFPTKVITGLTEQEKIAFVYRTVMTRRNMTHEQKEKLRESMKSLAKEMNKDHKQKEIAQHLGVTQSAVSKWLSDIEEFSNIPGNITKLDDHENSNHEPVDHKRVLSDYDISTIHNMLDNGDSQKSIAEEFGVSKGRISQIAKEYREQEQQQDTEGGEQEDDWTDEDYDHLVGDAEPDEETEEPHEEGGEDDNEVDEDDIEEDELLTPLVGGNILGSQYTLNDLECTFDGSCHNAQLWKLVSHFISHVRRLIKKNKRRKTIPLGDIEQFAREAQPFVRGSKL